MHPVEFSVSVQENRDTLSLCAGRAISPHMTKEEKKAVLGKGNGGWVLHSEKRGRGIFQFIFATISKSTGPWAPLTPQTSIHGGMTMRLNSG